MLEPAIPEHGEARPTLDLIPDKQAMKVVHTGHSVVIEPNDHISRAYSGRCGWRIGDHFMHTHTGALRQFESACQGFVNGGILASDPEVTSPNAPFFDEPACDELRCLASDRETNTLRGRDDGSVHTDDFATAIDEWPSRIARIQRCIRLNHVVD